MQLTFQGGAELARTLRRLPEAIAEKVLADAVVTAAQIIRTEAATKAPRPTDRRRPGTVRLSDSIKVRIAEQSRSYVTVSVGTSVAYAHLVEYGHQIVPRGKTREQFSITTVRISKKTGKQVVSTRMGLDPMGSQRQQQRPAQGFVPARPFLRPAFDENREHVLRVIGEVLWEGIASEARRLASLPVSAAA